MLEPYKNCYYDTCKVAFRHKGTAKVHKLNYGKKGEKKMEETNQIEGQSQEGEPTKEIKPSHSFFIAGVQHHQMHSVLKDLEEGQTLHLVLEPTNKYDPNAVRIEHKGTMLGFVPRKFSSEVTAMVTVGKTLECTISTLNKTAKPWEMCKVEIREVEE